MGALPYKKCQFSGLTWSPQSFDFEQTSSAEDIGVRSAARGVVFAIFRLWVYFGLRLFKPIHRFPTRFALHGGPKYAEGGRYVYFASRDGWVSKFDIFNLRYVAEIRAGINTRNITVSHDGRFVMVANYLPHTLVILDARDLSPVKVIEAKDGQGRSSGVSAVFTADRRRSFIADVMR